MSIFIIMICLMSGPQPCTEENSHALWRTEVVNSQCQRMVSAYVEVIKAAGLNPNNGYYVLGCKPVEPKA